jgi:hypothetical protein
MPHGRDARATNYKAAFHFARTLTGQRVKFTDADLKKGRCMQELPLANKHDEATPLQYATPQAGAPRSLTVGEWTVGAIAIVGFVVFTGYAIFPPLVGPHRGSRISNTSSQVTRLATAVQNFYQDYHRYPTNAEGLHILISPPPPNGEPYIDEKWPIVDEWKHPLIYQDLTTNGNAGFVITSRGYDGVLGTADDIIYRADPVAPAATNPAAAPTTQPTTVEPATQRPLESR